MSVTKDDVLSFLAAHPNFLSENQGFLREHQISLGVPSSTDNVINVTDRIAQRARDDARKAEAETHSLLSVAAENMLHWQELHLATLGFLACNNLQGFAQMVDEELPLIFGLAGSRLIMPAETALAEAEQLGFLVLPEDEITTLCHADTIYMGPPPDKGSGLFSCPTASMAIMKLPDQLEPPIRGSALVLAGRRPDSFEADKGRTLLIHLAEMVGVCLLSLIEAS